MSELDRLERKACEQPTTMTLEDRERLEQLQRYRDEDEADLPPIMRGTDWHDDE